MANLLKAINQSLQPTHDMIISWTHQTDNPTMVVKVTPGRTIPEAPPFTKIEYTVYISGICSRIESRECNYKTKEDTEPYNVRHTIQVFDGTNQRKLIDRIKGVRTTPIGSQHTENVNSFLIKSALCGFPFDITNMKYIKKYELIDSNIPGFCILDVTNIDGIRCRLVIDTEKNFNIIKLEAFFGNDRKEFQIETRLKQYDGIWYPAERVKKVYGSQSGKEITEYIETFTDVKFNADIPKDSFELEFPAGTRVWDSSIRDWITIGEENKTSAGQVEGKEVAEAENLVWGPDVNGLRAAVQFIPEKESYSLGEIIEIRFHIQNVSGQSISFSTAQWRNDAAQCIIEDSKGKETTYHMIPELGVPILVRKNLQSGEIATLECASLVIAKDEQQTSIIKTVGITAILKPGQYKFYYELRFPDILRKDNQDHIIFPKPEDWRGKLVTGKRNFIVLSQAKETPDVQSEKK